MLEELTGKYVENVTSASPEVVVRHLEPGKDYLVEVRAVNAKGVSQPFLLQAFALKVAENKIREYIVCVVYHHHQWCPYFILLFYYYSCVYLDLNLMISSKLPSGATNYAIG